MRIARIALAVVAGGAQAQDPVAKIAFDKGDYSTAVRLFEEANRKKPDCNNLFYAGLARYRLKQSNEALIAFRAAVECNPSLVEAHLALGDVYVQRGSDADALTAYLQALNLAPQNTAALRAAAALYLRNDVQAKAQSLLETLVAVDTRDAQAHADLAAVYAAGGDRDKAEKEFRTALKLKPNFPPALTGLGNLLLRSGDIDTALPLLIQAVKAQPRAYQPHFLLGSAYNRQNEFAKAAAELEEATRLGGKDPQIYYHLARAYGGLGRAEDRRQALAKFSEFTRQEKESAESQRRASRLVDEARTLMQSGDLQGAVNRLDQAREARPGDHTLLFRLAGLQFDLGQYGMARESVQAAIAISPSTWLYHYLLGLIEKGSGRWSDAQASLETAASLNTSAAEVQNALGEVAIRQGDKARAVAGFERAVQLNPAEPVYRQNLESAKR